MTTRPSARSGTSRRVRDAGFTLIEMLIALALSGIIAGVTVSALLTSMNVIDVTTEQINESTDAGLIAAWFYRDAQAAGGTSPLDGQADPSVGVSVVDSPEGWQGCIQPGALVVRFSWTDRIAGSAARDMVVTYGLEGTRLTRRACIDASGVDLVLAEHVGTAVATCDPGASCAGAPDRVSLRVTGIGTRVPIDQTFSASLRGLVAPPANATTSIASPLVVLGGSAAPCPPLQLTGTGTVGVLGDAVVAEGCGSTIGGTPALIQPTGTLTPLDPVLDPMSTMVPPTAGCGSGPNPSPIGLSSGATSIIVHPQPVVVTGTVVLQPGRYVFCNGLTIAADAVLDGSDVLLVVQGGTFQVDAGARVDLTAAPTGEYSNMLLWLAPAGAVAMDLGPGAITLRGLVYAPLADLTVRTEVAVGMGGLIARSVTFTGGGLVRLGLPMPAIDIAPITVAAGQSGAPYGPVAFSATGGTAPYRFVASSLPPGLSLTSGGQLSGLPTSAGTFAALISAVDASGAATSISLPITINTPAGIGGPATLPPGQVGAAYTPTTMTTSGGTAPFVWSATGLPPGVSITPTGTIAGTPTLAGPYTVAVTLTDALGITASRTYAVTIGVALAVADPATLPNGQVGTAYSTTTMTASGGTAPYLWSATGLPPGLAMSTSGVVTGTPTLAGSFSVVAYTSDAIGAFATRSYTVTIAAAGPPVPAGCPSTPLGWRGEYYANRTLTGAPPLCRDDASINFFWGSGSPGTGVPVDGFSARWTRTQTFTAGTYVFSMGSDDGSRLYIDGALVGDYWFDSGHTTRTITRTLAAGAHTIVMEYYENGGGASATLSWVEIVPATCPTTVTGWLGEYFGNRTLTAPATLCRNDASINFNWGAGTPGSPIPVDDFSVRWTRTLTFAAGSYTFVAGSDDGSRLYIDGVRVGDWWYDTSYVTRSVTRTLSAGSHTIVMEFYERGGSARATLTW